MSHPSQSSSLKKSKSNGSSNRNKHVSASPSTNLPFHHQFTSQSPPTVMSRNRSDPNPPTGSHYTPSSLPIDDHNSLSSQFTTTPPPHVYNYPNTDTSPTFPPFFFFSSSQQQQQQQQYQHHHFHHQYPQMPSLLQSFPQLAPPSFMNQFSPPFQNENREGILSSPDKTSSPIEYSSSVPALSGEVPAMAEDSIPSKSTTTTLNYTTTATATQQQQSAADTLPQTSSKADTTKTATNTPSKLISSPALFRNPNQFPLDSNQNFSRHTGQNKKHHYHERQHSSHQQNYQEPKYCFPGGASLSDHLDKKVMIVLRDGKKLVGIMRSFDQFANMVLENTVERIVVGNLFGDVSLGLYIVRGENVLLMGEIDEQKEKKQLSGKTNLRMVSIQEILQLQKKEKEEREEKLQQQKMIFKKKGITMDEDYAFC